MKKIFSFGLLLILIGSTPAFAIPTLQLDISDGTYDTISETVFATTGSFTLYALLTPQNNEDVESLLNNTYYISAAISPALDSPSSLGSFVFDGQTVDVTADMTYGVPPFDDAVQDFDNGDLSKHGVFPTYFTEFAFTFSDLQTVSTYNVQDDPGGFSGSGTGSYYIEFEVNTAGLADGYAVHFDLYDIIAKDGDLDAGIFAPFSHDAQSAPAPVPEPATMLLLGTGLLGIAGLSSRRLKRFK